MRLYDNTTRTNYEELRDLHYPLWYRDVLEMDGLMQVFGRELDEMQTGIVNVIANCFICSADAAAIKEFEQFLNITYDGPRTLEERRKVVASFFDGDAHIGAPEIQEVLSAFTTGDIAVALIGGTIEITVTREVSDLFNLSDSLYVLRKRIPAHLDIMFDDIVLPIRFYTANRFRLIDFSTFVTAFFNHPYPAPILLNGARSLDGTWVLNHIFKWPHKLAVSIQCAYPRMANRLADSTLQAGTYTIQTAGCGALISIEVQLSARNMQRFDQGEYFNISLSTTTLQRSAFTKLAFFIGRAKTVSAIGNPHFTASATVRNTQALNNHNTQFISGFQHTGALSGSVEKSTMYHLNGEVSLDGSRKLNAEIHQEVL